MHELLLTTNNFLIHLYSFFGEGKRPKDSPMRWTDQTRADADINLTYHIQCKIEEDGEK